MNEAPAIEVWTPLVRADELPRDGTGRVVEVAGHRIAVFWIEGAPHVIDDECPHEGGSLGEGVVLDGDVTCPWHGWHFRVRDGRNTDGLAACVAVHAARVSAEGFVEARLVGARA